VATLLAEVAAHGGGRSSDDRSVAVFARRPVETTSASGASPDRPRWVPTWTAPPSQRIPARACSQSHVSFREAKVPGRSAARRGRPGCRFRRPAVEDARSRRAGTFEPRSTLPGGA
jgi:hypothetical protein